MKTSLIKSKPLLFYGSLLLLTLPLFSYQTFKPSYTGAEDLREEVPLSINYDKKIITPVIEFRINNKSYNAVFDTGSSGIRIIGGALKGQVSESGNERVKYTYGDGKGALNLHGNVVAAPLMFGRLKTSIPVRMMSIDSAKYGPDASWTPIGDSTIIHSNHFRQLSAIMGVGLRLKPSAKGVASPLAQLPGNGKYIVKFPAYGGRRGSLVLNPTRQETEGFTLFHLNPDKSIIPGGYSSWLDNELDGCFYVNGTSYCMHTMLDCGSPNIQIFSPELTGRHAVTSGSQVIFEMKDKNDPLTGIRTEFFVSQNRETGKDYVYLNEIKGAGKSLFGTRCFFEYDVLYDQKNGIIGVRKK